MYIVIEKQLSVEIFQHSSFMTPTFYLILIIIKLKSGGIQTVAYPFFPLESI